MTQKLDFKLFIAILLVALQSCATGGGLPDQQVKRYRFPVDQVYSESDLKERRYQSLGLMKGKKNFNSMVETISFQDLCSNYFNQATSELIARAKKDRGADAIMNLQSVVYYANGAVELHKSPECSDDGAEGQILIQAQAIKFIPEPKTQKPLEH